MSVRVLALAVFLDYIAVGCIVPLLTLYAREANIAAPTIGFLSSMYGITQMLGTSLLVPYTDKSPHSSRRLLLIGSCFGALVAYLSLGFNRGSVIVVFGSRLLVGFFKHTMTASTAYVRLLHEDEHSRVQSLSRLKAASATGYILGPLLGGYLYDGTLSARDACEKIGFCAIEFERIGDFISDSLEPDGPRDGNLSAPALCASFLLFLELVILVMYLPVLKPQMKMVSPLFPQKKQTKHKKSSFIERFSVLKSSTVVLLLITLVFTIASQINHSMSTLFLMDRFSVDGKTLGFIASLKSFVGVLNHLFVLPFLTEYISTERYLLLSTLITAAGFSIQYLTFDLAFSVGLASSLVTLGTSSFATLFTSYYLSKFKSHQVGGALTLASFSEALSRFAGPLIGGWLVFHSNSSMPSLFATLSTLSVSLYLWALLPVMKREEFRLHDL